MKKVEYRTPEELKLLTDDVRQETASLVRRLKKKKPRTLDNVVHGLHDEAFDKFDCLDCANCCKTTGPLFTQKDINRIASQLKLSPIQFINKYLRVDEDNDYILQKVPCSFLGEDNYCSIYEFRPKACREYPHTDRINQLGILKLTEKNINICPAVANIFIQLAK